MFVTTVLILLLYLGFVHIFMICYDLLCYYCALCYYLLLCYYVAIVHIVTTLPGFCAHATGSEWTQQERISYLELLKIFTSIFILTVVSYSKLIKLLSFYIELDQNRSKGNFCFFNHAARYFINLGRFYNITSRPPATFMATRLASFAILTHFQIL